ncbi:hypothetical protein COL5a_002659 [Colletotrichum fioriniae]|uniref:uncharacterized protein n=1 Tax=Colletotrichum fioriniae TaxID=710243 RepID=UPI00230154A7|nr:uncharacterized protein COL516b_004965 [Colletotrichum fioriniae]KAJ0305857.1 hypothetical protein COL516b_004965 [Colletotrichum fioriniae]KAJ0331126.1 hypothetical protein COL5a_002659 [Colletotrichum fioriniae]KAJ3950280.1 hypothetical protein N0V96_001424 [Colletotrichum fioriniae]
MADLGKSTEGSKVSTVITTIALDADFPSSVAGASTEVPAILEDDKSDDGLKTADPERNASDDERQLVNGGVVIRDGHFGLKEHAVASILSTSSGNGAAIVQVFGAERL